MAGFAPLMPAGTLNVALSNYAKDFRDQKLIGDVICPRVPANRQSFQYVVWSQDDYRTPDSTYRAPGTEPNSIRKTYSTGTYFARAHALQGDVPFETEAYGLGLNFSTRQKLTASLIRRLNLFRESEIATAALSTTNFPNGKTFSGYSMWDTYITSSTNDVSSPLSDVEAAKEALRQVGIADEEMVLILSSPVVTVLANHPKLIDRFKYTNPLGYISIDQMSSAFGVKCIRAGAVQVSKNNVKSWVWGNSAFLGYAQAAPSMEDLSCMKTFSWTGEEDGGVASGLVAPGAQGFAVIEWPDPQRSKKTWWQSAEWYYDTVITATEAGYPLLSLVSGDTMETVPADSEG